MLEENCTKEGENEEEEEDDVIMAVPPDGGWGWAIVFGSFMIHIITDGVTYAFGVFYDEFLTYFNEGKGATAWVLSILVGVTLCSGPISSAFVNRWGCRPVTIAGAIIASICMIFSVFANNIKTLYLTIGVGTGFGFGLIYLPAIISVTTYFEKKRSLATGIAVCGSGFGTFIFAPLIAKLLLEFGWRGALLIIAGLVLNCILFGALFRPLKENKISGKQTLKLLKAPNFNPDDPTSDTNFLPDAKLNRPQSIGHIGHIGHNAENRDNVKNLPRLALSQPMLSWNDDGNQWHRFGSQGFRRIGPLDKPDVFYQGSLLNIPSYKSSLNLKNKFGSAQFRHSLKRNGRRISEPCSETKNFFRQILDFNLFKDWVFVIFALSNFLTSVGFNIPYVYIVPRAKALNLTIDQASILLSVIGIANTFGRIILGYISDKPWVNRLLIYNWCLTVCGIATFASAFCETFTTLILYCIVFGFTIGAYVGLTSVILVDLLGLEKLTNAFGLLLLFQGIASLIGPPMAGVLYDLTLSYDNGFYLSGITICLSGIILFLILPIQKWMSRCERKRALDDNRDRT